MSLRSILCFYLCENIHLMLIENRGLGYLIARGGEGVAVIILQWKGEGICNMGIREMREYRELVLGKP